MRKFKNIKPIRRHRVGRPPKRQTYVMSQNALLGVLPSCLLAVAIIAIVLTRYNTLQALPTITIPRIVMSAVSAKPMIETYHALMRSFPQTVPSVALPEVKLPQMSLPRVSAPPLHTPKISVPKIIIPQFPAVSFPKFDLRIPKISLPSLNMPKIRVQVDFTPFISAITTVLKLLNPVPLLRTVFAGLVNLLKRLTDSLISIIKFVDPRPVLRLLYSFIAQIFLTVYRGLLSIVLAVRSLIFGVFSVIFRTIEAVISFFVGIYTAFLRSVIAVVSIFSPYVQWVVRVSASGWNDLLVSLTALLNATASAME